MASRFFNLLVSERYLVEIFCPPKAVTHSIIERFAISQIGEQNFWQFQNFQYCHVDFEPLIARPALTIERFLVRMIERKAPIDAVGTEWPHRQQYYIAVKCREFRRWRIASKTVIRFEAIVIEHAVLVEKQCQPLRNRIRFE